MIPKTTDLLAMATRFQVDAELRIEKRGEDSWAVCSDSGACLNTDYELEYEPSPSNRDEEFIARARYTLAGAFQQITAFRTFQKSLPLLKMKVGDFQTPDLKDQIDSITVGDLVVVRLGRPELGTEATVLEIQEVTSEDGEVSYNGVTSHDMVSPWGQPAGTKVQFQPINIVEIRKASPKDAPSDTHPAITQKDNT
ncbi:hypothetical protein [Salipiger sp. PrR003]|uniref:hypothetical protein n=1 Tax=Salipiger sp. PrR003 TaxID=2706776 RepID=UPI0013DC595A|nr:hypothetical protein [Salipiger sp. PrR003]NDV52739.1 hypothetical protein [Salipiger sp. PrR003]